ncbi:hypothetical protein [Sphingobium sp. MI1205]|uniref:hypothetical protein n=1 Tax=Sphingobium sp. MI1205 TaxID=407020 RepID=UPI0007701875|nr:hypothetical protein [Sphingobium sp. MI1205]AMK19348.1 hypothetical protein K663_14850 [Sphingobium sp. MI1205]
MSVSALHPAHRDGRSIFPSRVFEAGEVKRVLKTGHQSRKIGKVVMKGHRKGWPIFTLTLEERATCPRSCQAWGWCYGNNMQAAERIVADHALEAGLWRELEQLQRAHPGGYLVRVHILGDFYSVGYVDLWARALKAFPALHVFGFSARDPGCDPIGQALDQLASADWQRFALRFSGRPGSERASRLVSGDEVDEAAILCPAQTGATDCCATCALCWQSAKSIAFRRH